MRKITKILIICLLIILAGFAWFSHLHRENKERSSTAVFVIDAGFQREVRREVQPRSPAPLPGHGQLTSDLIARRAGELAVIRELELEGGGERRRQNFLEHLLYIGDYARSNPDEKIFVNISLAFSEPSPTEKRVIEDLERFNVLVVAAAGNSGDERVFYPAGYPGVLSVSGASSRGRYDYATYGEHIDLAAPGGIRRLLPRDFGSFSMTRFETQGTSFSAPRVVGELARLAALTDQDVDPGQLAELSQRKAANISDDIYREGLLGSGLFQPGRLERYFLPELFWRTRLLYLMAVMILPTIYFMTGDFIRWRRRKSITSAAGEKKLADLAEEAPADYISLIDKKLSSSRYLSRRKFCRHLLKAEVDFSRVADFLGELSEEELYHLLIDVLENEEIDPEKLAHNLVRGDRSLARGMTERVDWRRRAEKCDRREFEMRFLLRIFLELRSFAEAGELAALIIKKSSLPWLLHYSLRALKRLDSSLEEIGLEPGDLQRLKNLDHPLIAGELSEIRARTQNNGLEVE